MSLAPLRGSGVTRHGPPAGGRGRDDLRDCWSEFIGEDPMVMRTHSTSLFMCDACDPMSLFLGMVRSVKPDYVEINSVPSNFEASYTPLGVDWDFEEFALETADRERLQPVYVSSGELKDVIFDVPLERSDPPGVVPALDDVERVLLYLRGRGLDDLADDLEYKKCLIEEDPDESPISPKSARRFAAFVTTKPLAGSPNVIVDSRGHVGLEWIIPDPFPQGSGPRVVTTGWGDDHVWGRGDGVLGLWFLPNGLVRVCGTSGPVGQGVDRMRRNSTVPPAYVMSEVEPFLSRLEGM